MPGREYVSLGTNQDTAAATRLLSFLLGDDKNHELVGAVCQPERTEQKEKSAENGQSACLQLAA